MNWAASNLQHRWKLWKKLPRKVYASKNQVATENKAIDEPYLALFKNWRLDPFHFRWFNITLSRYLFLDSLMWYFWPSKMKLISLLCRFVLVFWNFHQLCHMKFSLSCDILCLVKAFEFYFHLRRISRNLIPQRITAGSY